MIVPSVTTVKPLVRIRRERRLPHAGEIRVSVGEEVSPVQVVARTSEQRGFAIIPVADMLDLPAEDVPKYLLVKEGAAIQKKKPLLRKSGLFGSKQYSSPVNGVLYQVSNGRLILQQTPDLMELRAMVHGYVANILGNYGITIETTGTLIQAVWSSDREGFGNIRVVANNDQPLRPNHIDLDARGSILVAGHLDQTQVLEKAEENSVRGVVVGSVPAVLAPSLHHYRFPIVATGGFGRRPMADPIFRLLQQSEGREASLFSRSRDRRPEIIIPLPAPEGSAGPPQSPPALAVGQRVRLLRAPHFGEVGKIVAVDTRARPSSIGLRMPGADVELAEGEIMFVPYPNLDIME